MTATPTDPHAPELGSDCAEVLAIVREAAHGGHMDRFRSNLAQMTTVLLTPEHPAQAYLAGNITDPMREALQAHWAPASSWQEPIPEVRHMRWLFWEVGGIRLKLRAGRLAWAVFLEDETRSLLLASEGLFGEGLAEEVAEALSRGLSLWPMMSKINEGWAALRSTSAGAAFDLSTHGNFTERRLRLFLAATAVRQVVDFPNLSEGALPAYSQERATP